MKNLANNLDWIIWALCAAVFTFTVVAMVTQPDGNVQVVRSTLLIWVFIAAMQTFTARVYRKMR